MSGQRITPPGTNAEVAVLTPAPVDHDRGILINRPDTFTTVDTPYKPQNPCPLDERALALGLHVTLLIAPTGVDQTCSQKVDGHHGAAFPASNPALGGNLQPVTKDQEMIRDDLRVIRWSRIQETERLLHNKCHSEHDGVTLPFDEHENFIVLLLNAARYIPAQGMDFSRRKPRIITLDEEMKRRLQLPGVIYNQERMEKRIGYYFGRYIVKYGLPSVKEITEVSQFLETTDELARLRLGNRIIRLASRAVIDPAESLYQSARAAGRLSPNSPKRALGFMMKHFDNKQPDYFCYIEQQLKKEIPRLAS